MLLPFEIELYYFLRNKPGWFNFLSLLGNSQEKIKEYEEFDEERKRLDNEEEKCYRWNISLDGKRNEFEFITEIQKDMPEMILENKKNEIETLTKKLEAILKRIEEMQWKGIAPWWIKLITEINNPEAIVKQIKELKKDIYFIENKNKSLEEQIDEQDIIRAKEYPMENLIQVDKRGFGPCPYHQEKTPSFYIKKNFGYCFGCGKSVDTIQLIMDTKGISFIDAVKFLK
jgi:hypothetical protein